MTILLLFERVERERKVVFVTCPPFLPVAMWFVCPVREWEYTYIASDLYPDEPAGAGYFSKNRRRRTGVVQGTTGSG